MARKDPYKTSLKGGQGLKLRQKFDKPITKDGKTTGFYILPGETLYQAATRLKIDPRLVADAKSMTGGPGFKTAYDMLVENTPFTYGGIIEDLPSTVNAKTGAAANLNWVDGKLQSLTQKGRYTGWGIERVLGRPDAREGGYLQDIELGNYVEPDNMMDALNQPMFGGKGLPAYSPLGGSLSGQAPYGSTPRLSTKTQAYQGTPEQIAAQNQELQPTTYNTTGANQASPQTRLTYRGGKWVSVPTDASGREIIGGVAGGGTTGGGVVGGGVISSSTAAKQEADSLSADVQAILDEGLATEELSNQIFDAYEEELQKQHEEALNAINSASDPTRQATGEQQAGQRTAQTSQLLGGAGGYLGSSVSHVGAQLQLVKSQRRQMSMLEAKRQGLIKGAQQDLADGLAQNAKDKFDQAQEIRKEYNDMADKLIDDAIKFEKDQREATEKQAKAAREAFEFAMDNNITSPYYTLDGYTYWDAATGQMVDPSQIEDASMVQIIDPSESAIEFETRTVDKKVVRFGFDSQGNIVSRVELGKSGSTSSGGTGVTGMTTSERKKYNELVQRYDDGGDAQDLLDKASGIVYTKLKEYIDQKKESDEEQQVMGEETAKQDRLDEYANSGDDFQEKVAYLYSVKYGFEPGDFAETYAEILKELAEGTGTAAFWRNKLNKALEYIDNG